VKAGRKVFRFQVSSFGLKVISRFHDFAIW
jgi:hypothetical protein